jgi:oxygen-independent coproporphyrinogen III oxidase
MKGIYIHIPFCISKCPYCDFTSFEDGDQKGYIKTIRDEIRLCDAEHMDSVDTIFFGGGTPTSLMPILIESVLDTLRESFDIKETAEITIEANPGTVNAKKLLAYKRAGINRISFGLQSADDKELLALGRVHNFKEFEESFRMARKAGFDNINIDIMFGLPNQKVDGFSKTVRRVIEKNPEHISCYGLKIEKGTEFYKKYYGTSFLPGDIIERDMYHMAREAFEKSGYNHYETSNFAKKGMECKHNLKYWHAEEYLGFGVSAHSYFIKGGVHIRQGNTSDMSKYIEDISNDVMPIDEKNILSKKDIQDEYIMLNLRLSTGINFLDFKSKFGFDFKDKFKSEIKKLLKGGLIKQDEEGIYPLPKGFDLQNSMIILFL